MYFHRIFSLLPSTSMEAQLPSTSMEAQLPSTSIEYYIYFHHLLPWKLTSRTSLFGNMPASMQVAAASMEKTNYFRILPCASHLPYKTCDYRTNFKYNFLVNDGCKRHARRVRNVLDELLPTTPFWSAGVKDGNSGKLHVSSSKPLEGCVGVGRSPWK